MILHPDWGWAVIFDIQAKSILLKFEGNFYVWVDRTEIQHRIPNKMPRSKTEAEFFRRMGYAVPDLTESAGTRLCGISP